MNRRQLLKSACWAVSAALAPLPALGTNLDFSGVPGVSVGCFIGPFVAASGATVVIMFDEFECEQFDPVLFADGFESH